MMCDCCGKTITGRPETRDHVSASGGGITLYLCPGYCKPAPRQRTQEKPVELPIQNPRSRPRRSPRR